MKKAWALGATLAAVAGAAQAQSNVTLYGIIDDGLTYVTNQGGHNLWALQPGISQGDRWGMKGTEDLGGGLSTIFTLENGFNGNTGTLSQGGREFGRAAWVGLSSKQYGTVIAGRMDDITNFFLNQYTANYWGILFPHPGDMDNNGSSFRMNNTVRYSTPVYNGVQAAVQYSFGNTTQFNAQSSVAGGLSYNNGPVSLAAAFITISQPATSVSEGNWTASNTVDGNYGIAAGRYQVAGAGGSYNFGKLKLSAEWTNTKFTEMNPALGAKIGGTAMFNIYEVTASYWFTPFLMLGSNYIYTRGHIAATDKTPVYHTAGVILDYFLSKRTDVYAQATVMQASGDATQAALVPILTASSNNRQLEARIGVRHKF